MIRFYSVSFLLLLYTVVFSQEEKRCGTTTRPLSPELELLIKQHTKNVTQNSNGRLQQEVLTIPVVVHILYNTDKQNFTDDQVHEQIRVLNEDFRRLNADRANTPAPFATVAGDAGIQFVLAKQDPNGNPTTGITRNRTDRTSFTNVEMKFASSGGTNAWDTRFYYNIWVGPTTEFIGFSSNVTPGSDSDGIMVTTKAFSTYGESISPKFNKGRTVTHETGHWLSLIHIWGDATCGDDQIDDTPTQNSATSDNLHCPIFPYKASGDNSCNVGDNGRMFPNFLDYTRDECMNLFTQGQVDRMRSTLLLARDKILISKGLQSPFTYDLAVLGFRFDSTKACAGQEAVAPPLITIQNRGKTAVQGFDIHVLIDGIEKTYTWSGNLEVNEFLYWEIPDFEPSESVLVKWEIKVDAVLPLEDEYLANNSLSFQYKCSKPLSIYPNPTSEFLHVRGNDPIINKATFYTMEGKFIASTPVIARKEINVSFLPNGSYLVFLETEQGTVRKKLVIVR